MSEIIYKKQIVEGNPYYAVYQKSARKAVFLLHGLYGNPKDWFVLANKLALEDYYVIIPQARWHGDRMPINFHYLYAGKSFMSSMTNTMNSFVMSVIAILNKLIDNNIVEDKVAVVGFSMGAYVSYLLPLFDNRFEVLIPISGSAYYNDEKAIEHFKIENTEKPKNAVMQAGDNLDVFVNRKILIVHNKDDQTVSYFGSEKFYNSLSKIMNLGEIKLILQEKGGHHYYPYLDELILEWLDKYLKE